jgi:DNA-binding NtrC family response regulator
MVPTHDPSRFAVLLPTEQDGWNETVSRLLEPQGVKTIVARSGREALGLIESTPLHAVVLDTQMPQLGGLQVIKLMREKNASLPAILLTNRLTNHLLREALGMHVFSVLAKPVDFNLLLDALARILRRYHENRWPEN